MSRIARDELKFCNDHNVCFDCHSANGVKTAVEFQVRGRFAVPACRVHANACRRRNSRANIAKYARRSAARRKARLCVCPGCHNKLIPQEILPPWIREISCGMHCRTKASRENRIGLLHLIVEQCFTEEERKNMKAQNIIYKRGVPFVWFSAQFPGYYQTKVLSASGLLQLYRQTTQK